MRTFALVSLPWLFFRTQSMVDALTLLSWLRAGWDSLPALLGWLAPLVLPLAYLPLAEGLDGAYHLLRSLPRDKLGRLAGAFPAFAGQKFSCFVQGAPPAPGGVPPGFLQREGGRLLPPVRPKRDAATPIRFEADMVKDEFAGRVRVYARAAEEAGAAVWYAPCPMNAQAVEDGADVDGFYAALQEKLGVPLAGDPRDFILAAGWFYDTNFHPNFSGKAVYTRALVRTVKAMLGGRTRRCTSPRRPCPPTARIIFDPAMEFQFVQFHEDTCPILRGATSWGCKTTPPARLTRTAPCQSPRGRWRSPRWITSSTPRGWST